MLELRIRPQETKTKNQPPGVAGIPTMGGTICERTVESRLLLPRSAPLLWWWDQVGRLGQGSHWFVVGRRSLVSINSQIIEKVNFCSIIRFHKELRL